MTFESIDNIWRLSPFGSTSAEPQNDQQTNQQQTNQQQDPPGNQATQDNPDDDDPYAGLSAKELKRLLSDTEKAKGTTEAERKALQDKIDADTRKQQTREQNLENDLTTEKQTNSSLREALRRSQLENNILKDERFTWHNTDDVISKLPESVKVDDNGNVSGLASALTKIATNNEYLVKTRKDQQDSQQQQNNGNQNNQQQPNNSNYGPTGFQPGQGGANQGGGVAPNAQELQKNYPALASRINGGVAPPPAPMPMPQQY